ncbi:zinc-ribbon domain containing protein [Acidovorax delafieldii]|uniref:zinc-ribbon domain containing protein n=1 Tax=Acidovorax delafieldii TaxID=47920 RepID=UPI003F4FF1C6
MAAIGHKRPLTKSLDMTISIDRSQWCRRSQRTTGHYDEDATEYEGIRCKCRLCTRSFVFTAEEQKNAYEVEKRFVWYLPKHCKECASHRESIEESTKASSQELGVSLNPVSC